MRNLQLDLEKFTTFTEFELLEVSRRKQYKNGQPTDNYETVYTVLINFDQVDIRIGDDGAIMEQAQVIANYKQSGDPLMVSFEGCKITVYPESQYSLMARGTALKATVYESE